MESFDIRYKDAADISLRNSDEAMAKALSLIEEGFDEAGFLVGAIFESKGDFDIAYRYYERAFRDGGSVLACIGLARLNLLGRCKDASAQKAFECYYFLLDVADHPMAKMMIGRMYLEGIWVNKDLDKAEALLLEAARESYVFSFSFLSRLYFRKGDYIKSLFFGFRGLLAFILADKKSLSSSYI